MIFDDQSADQTLFRQLHDFGKGRARKRYARPAVVNENAGIVEPVFFRVLFKNSLLIFDIWLGEVDGVPIYSNSNLFNGFDAGTPTAVIDYGDFYLIVSENDTGVYENTPSYISSVWYYTETVYSAYNKNGDLLFRASTDSSPDYNELASIEY